jgi:Asp-tRNA(Asn)/Glu-tRNA(Gln) amidotransferase A subunit family amidase
LRIRRGDGVSAADYIDLIRAPSLIGAEPHWPASMQCPPTVPTAPPLQPLIDSDDNSFANTLLLRNPSLVNLLDGCALSLPCHREGDWPMGLMVWGPAMADDRVLGVSLAIQQALQDSA